MPKEKEMTIEFEELPGISKKYKVTRLVNFVDCKIGEILDLADVREIVIHRPNIKWNIKLNRQQKR